MIKAETHLGMSKAETPLGMFKAETVWWVFPRPPSLVNFVRF